VSEKRAVVLVLENVTGMVPKLWRSQEIGKDPRDNQTTCPYQKKWIDATF
jgi:hypothetical protein